MSDKSVIHIHSLPNEHISMYEGIDIAIDRWKLCQSQHYIKFSDTPIPSIERNRNSHTMVLESVKGIFFMPHYLE